MASTYNSFFVRHWQLRSGEVRLVIEHIQSGDRLLTPSLESAATWIGRCAATAVDRVAESVEKQEYWRGDAEPDVDVELGEQSALG